MTRIDARRDVDTEQMRDRLHHYTGFETPSGHPRELDELLDVLDRRYTDLGARTERDPHETGANLVARFPGHGAHAHANPVLCLGHHDTVWPLGALTGQVPWQERDGIIRGPGVYDMKGGLVVFETAIALLNRLDVAHRPVTMVLVADEEIGSPQARELITSLSADAVAALGFEPPHPDGSLKTARWGSSRVRVVVTGRESHAALAPADGVSAIEELLDQLLAVRRIVTDHPDVLCNIGSVSGGGRTNVVPGTAQAEIGLRFTDTATETTVLQRIRDLTPMRADASVHAEVLTSRPVWPSAPLPRRLADALRTATELTGQQASGEPASGAADTNVTGSLDVPSLDGLGPVGRGAHAPDEQIHAESLPQRAALTAGLLAAL